MLNPGVSRDGIIELGIHVPRGIAPTRPSAGGSGKLMVDKLTLGGPEIEAAAEIRLVPTRHPYGEYHKFMPGSLVGMPCDWGTDSRYGSSLATVDPALNLGFCDNSDAGSRVLARSLDDYGLPILTESSPIFKFGKVIAATDEFIVLSKSDGDVVTASILPYHFDRTANRIQVKPSGAKNIQYSRHQVPAVFFDANTIAFCGDGKEDQHSLHAYDIRSGGFCRKEQPFSDIQGAGKHAYIKSLLQIHQGPLRGVVAVFDKNTGNIGASIMRHRGDDGIWREIQLPPQFKDFVIMDVLLAPDCKRASLLVEVFANRLVHNYSGEIVGGFQGRWTLVADPINKRWEWYEGSVSVMTDTTLRISHGYGSNKTTVDIPRVQQG